MTLANRLRLAALRRGLDVQRASASAEALAFRAFTSPDPDVILDIGANDGGFGRLSRALGYRGDLVSFEPGTTAFALLQRAAARDPRWDVHQTALGATPGTATLHLAANHGASSSILPMLGAHAAAAPEAQYVDAEPVAVQRLDDWYAAHGSGWRRPALKLDVQGFESQVLAGATAMFESVVAVHIELSTVPLYEGGWLWGEMTRWLEDRDFTLAGLAPVFADSTTGALLAFDGVFLRR